MNKKVWIPVNTKDPSENFLNLKDLSFGFLNKGLTIIVGENNVGKTKLLDYIYQENRKWDNFEDGYEDGYTKLLPMFFREDFNVCIPNHEYYAKLEKKGRLRCEYEIYYFDLESSFFQLIEKYKDEKETRKRITFKNGRKRGLWTYYTEKNKDLWYLKSVVIESEKMEETNPIEQVLIEYKDKKNFGTDTVTGIRGKYESLGIHHSITEIGSGFIKCKTLENLIDKIIEKNKNENQGTKKRIDSWLPEEKIYTPILLIDEPELLLHSSLISDIVERIKKLEESNITTILTTHSPFLLHPFIQQKEGIANLVIMQKGKQGNLENPLYLWIFLSSNEIRKKIESEYGYFAEKNDENVGDPEFYISKWKRLFNQETLRVFFAKKVLFVEGITDYILFNNILKERLEEELKGVEIIPIFGKFHYIFFYELAKWLNLDFWFLLDEDKYKEQNGQEHWKKPRRKEDIHKIFWEKHGESKAFVETNGIMHSKEENKTKISWIRFDLEAFLGIKAESAEDKEYNLISRATTVLKTLKDGSVKLNELKKILRFINPKI